VDPSKHVFPDAVTRAVTRKQATFGLPAWTVHDIRRSVATGMKALGVTQETLDRVLSHVPPKLQRTYNVHDYLAEQRQALDLWAAALSSPTVVAFPKAGARS
jgi:integrase